MLASKIELYGTEDTVIRPILITVSEDIKNLLGITKDIFTTYDTRDAITKGKNNVGRIVNENKMHERMISVEYTEATEDATELSITPIKPDYHPVYRDDDIGANITPIFLNTKMNVRLRYIDSSKSKINGILNRIRLFSSNDGMHRRHNLEYYYVMPGYVLSLLEHINDLKNKREVDKKDLDSYVNDTFDNRVDFMNTQDTATEKTSLVIREVQNEVLGAITDDVHDINPEYDDTAGRWYIEFNYEFFYEKPAALMLKYPILVYNTIIDKRFKTFIKQTPIDRNAYRTNRGGSLIPLTVNKNPFGIRTTKDYLVFPEEDTFKLNTPPRFITRLMSILVSVDLDSPTELFNIEQLPKVKFKESIKKFLLESDREYIGHMHKGMFYFELYRNGKIDSNVIQMDEDGNLYTSEPMDIKSTYRVVINIVNDLNMVSVNSRKRIKSYISNEIEELKNIKTERELSISKDRAKESKREYNPTGVEYFDYESLAEVYLNIFNIEHDDIINMLVKTPRVEELVFKITDPKFDMFKTKQLLNVYVHLLSGK